MVFVFARHKVKNRRWNSRTLRPPQFWSPCLRHPFDTFKPYSTCSYTDNFYPIFLLLNLGVQVPHSAVGVICFSINCSLELSGNTSDLEKYGRHDKFGSGMNGMTIPFPSNSLKYTFKGLNLRILKKCRRKLQSYLGWVSCKAEFLFS